MTLPPLGIILGTTIILPLLIWYSGKENRVKFVNILWTILVFYLISRTLDWFFAPGTHDSQGIAWMFLMSIFSSITMIGIWIFYLKHKNLNPKETKTYIILICFLIIPFVHIQLLNKFCNQNLNVTNKTLYQYFKNE
ncbi:hypothetical protein EAH69_13740 [Faecalibacter macacae]|uniref:Uncharacterized protein n=1 Tax=Faecalibacter macacae TaxID=1859289 RepID=A0A3L9M0V0_9FLAO|nr:hypothetical protein EAH69_13740 [Faecalibacter macacae]